jgi:hypothetical protein
MNAQEAVDRSEALAQRSGATLLRLTLGYGSFDNNGNLRTQFVETGVKTFQQAFGYDAANRISTYQETTVGLPGEPTRTQNFGYDGFGNGWRTTVGSTSRESPITA